MSKTKIIFIAVLTALCFGASFSISLLLRAPGQSAVDHKGPQDSTEAEDQKDEKALAAAAISALGPKEKVVEELTRELRQKIEEYRHKLAQFEKREKRLALATENLKKQASELDNLRIQLVAPLTRLKEAQAKLAQSRVMIKKEEEANLKKMAEIYAKMDAGEASKILVNIYDSGQESDAAIILHFMSQRSAAKLLAAISDKSLAARLCDRMKRIREAG